MPCSQYEAFFVSVAHSEADMDRLRRHGRHWRNRCNPDSRTRYHTKAERRRKERKNRKKGKKTAKKAAAKLDYLSLCAWRLCVRSFVLRSFLAIVFLFGKIAVLDP